MSYEEPGPDGSCREGIIERYGHVIRVRETAPGVWVPDKRGEHEIYADMLPYFAASLTQDAHREVIRAATRERERAYAEHLAGAMTRDELRYLGITDPDRGVTSPALRVALPVPDAGELAALRAALEAAKNRPPVVLSSGYVPEKTLAAAGEPGTCRYCGGQLRGQLLAEADERGNFGYCADNPCGNRAHEAGPALELTAGGPFLAVVVERPARTEPETGQMDPADAIRASLYEPLMLDEAALDELAPYGKAGPGLCRECRVGRTLKGTGGLCYYCDLSKRLAAAQAPELAMARTATAQARAALKAPQAPACGRTGAVTWVERACGCTSAHAHEMARRRVSCRHKSVRDGACTRCGTAVTPGTAISPVVLARVRRLVVIFGVLFLYLGAHGTWLWYLAAAAAYLVTAKFILPKITRRQQ